MFEWVQWGNPVALWWIFLTSASIVNICIWFWLRYYRFSGIGFSSVFSFHKNPRSIIWLSFLYVFVCAFRSFMPRADVQRICLFDTWFSSVFLGRTLATFAELAFVAQWSILLGIIAVTLKDSLIKKLSQAILVLILVAEVCSWYAVITTHYLGNVIEESLWGFTYILVGTALFRVWLKVKGPVRLACGFAIVGCAVYVGFMFTVDVPMYWTRMFQDMATQKPYLSFVQGIVDLNTRWIVTHDIVDWKSEIPWKTLYFTFAVLVSLALCLMPLTSDGWKKYLKN